MLAVVAACSSDPATPVVANDPGVELVHLVGDGGSTGTRFCVFVTRKYAATKDAAGSCAEPREFRLFKGSDGKETHCISKSSYDANSTKLPITATGGLQDLAQDPAKGGELVEQAIVEVEKALTAHGKKLSAAAILGTSGFRDDTGTIQEAPYVDLWKSVSQVFEKRQIPVVTRALHADEEARFAWTTIRFLHLQNQAFSTIETGGGGCNFATGEAGAEYKDVKSASDPIGTSRAWHAYAADDLRQVEIPTLKEPLFKACYSGKSADATGQDATACVAFLKSRVFDASSINQTAKQLLPAAGARTLYGMGPAWNGLFTTYFPGKGSVSLKDVHLAAVDECARPQKDARGYIPHMSCFAISFQEAFLQTAAGSDGVIRNGIESWPRGASVSPGGEFESCKDSTIKVTVQE